jgi:hypothetical protein
MRMPSNALASRFCVAFIASSLAIGGAVAADPPASPAASAGALAAIDLGRFAVTCPGVVPAGGAPPLAYSFRATILSGAADADAVRSSLPGYRDAVVVVSHGYCGFVARNGRRASPEELARLIEARASAAEDSPRVTVTLPDFVEKHLEAR